RPTTTSASAGDCSPLRSPSRSATSLHPLVPWLVDLIGETRKAAGLRRRPLEVLPFTGAYGEGFQSRRLGGSSTSTNMPVAALMGWSLAGGVDQAHGEMAPARPAAPARGRGAAAEVWAPALRYATVVVIGFLIGLGSSGGRSKVSGIELRPCIARQ